MVTKFVEYLIATHMTKSSRLVLMKAFSQALLAAIQDLDTTDVVEACKLMREYEEGKA